MVAIQLISIDDAGETIEKHYTFPKAFENLKELYLTYNTQDYSCTVIGYNDLGEELINVKHYLDYSWIIPICDQKVFMLTFKKQFYEQN